MLDNAALNFMLAFKDPLDYKKAEEIIKQRITLLKAFPGHGIPAQGRN